MSKCPNCGSVLTCGCQKKQLPDGKIGCNKCISNLQKSSNNTNPEKKKE